MKKSSLIVLIVLMLFAFSLVASASQWEYVGGITNNTIDTEIDLTTNCNNNLEIKEEGLANGCGYFFGVRYWLKRKIAIGAGYDSVTADGNIDFNLDCNEFCFNEVNLNKEGNLGGPYCEIVYKLNNTFSFNGAVVAYDYKLKGNFSTDCECIPAFDEELLEGEGTGFIFGATMKHPISKDFELFCNAGYRKANIEATKIYDGDELVDAECILDKLDLEFSGLRAAAGISYKF